MATGTRPVLALQGFARVSLLAGLAEVSFLLDVVSLGFTVSELDSRLEAGEIQLYVGTSSVDPLDAGTIVIDDRPTGLSTRAHTNTVDVEVLVADAPI